MHYKYVEKEDMVVGDMVAGVCYAAAAEDIIDNLVEMVGDEGQDSYSPTVIGYMVAAHSDEDELGVRRGDCGDECECWAPEEVDE